MVDTSCYTGVENDDLCDGNMHLSCVSGMGRTRLVIKATEGDGKLCVMLCDLM